MIARFAALYQTYLEELLLNHNNVWTDQVVLTHIYKHNKHLFKELTRGYGTIIPALKGALYGFKKTSKVSLGIKGK